jgi:hypothetical protein
MLQAVDTIQPALADFYAALNDDQKARFNTMGKQLFAENHELLSLYLLISICQLEWIARSRAKPEHAILFDVE